MMTTVSLMQRVLAEDWYKLPAIIQAHYNITQPHQSITVTGKLCIAYPYWLTPLLKLFRLLGALVDVTGDNLPVQVKKWQDSDPLVLYWQRYIRATNGKQCCFASRMIWQGDHELIEWVGIFGIRLTLSVEQGTLIYCSHGHVMKLGSFILPIPDNLLLGHAVISEQALSDDSFRLHFAIVHPLWGRTYYYGGIFKVM